MGNREKSNADLESSQLREKMLDAELKRGEITIESLQDEVNAAAEQLSTSNEEHVETVAALTTKIAGLQNDLDVVKDDNAMLARRVEVGSVDLEVKQTTVARLERDTKEALKQVGLIEKKSHADLESFRLQEEMLKAEIRKGEVAVESAEEQLKTMSRGRAETTTIL